MQTTKFYSGHSLQCVYVCSKRCLSLHVCHALRNVLQIQALDSSHMIKSKLAKILTKRQEFYDFKSIGWPINIKHSYQIDQSSYTWSIIQDPRLDRRCRFYIDHQGSLLPAKSWVFSVRCPWTTQILTFIKINSEIPKKYDKKKNFPTKLILI